MESNQQKYPELEAVDVALAAAAERLTEAHKRYLDLIAARIALRSIMESESE